MTQVNPWMDEMMTLNANGAPGTTSGTHPMLVDEAPPREAFTLDVVRGLSTVPKSIPCKYFYDERGSLLFDRICELDEYYLTRTELAITKSRLVEIVRCLGSDCILVEYGSGSSLKTRLLIDRMPNLKVYAPVDISREHLVGASRTLHRLYPELRIEPICADYTRPFPLPVADSARTVVYFPGSTIGNFHPVQAQDLLKSIHTVCGAGGALLIGVDLKKDPAVIHAAYNDRAGVTAEFNKNLLFRINNELGADFALPAFDHQAIYNEVDGRVEMYLVSSTEQRVQLNGATLHFEEGERILTEYSYKFTVEGFEELAASAGFCLEQVWSDERHRFAVIYLLAL